MIFFSIFLIVSGAYSFYWAISASRNFKWLRLPLVLVGTLLCVFGLVLLVNGLVIITATIYEKAFDNLPMDDGTKFIELIRISVSIVTPIVTVLSAVTVATIGYVVKNKK